MEARPLANVTAIKGFPRFLPLLIAAASFVTQDGVGLQVRTSRMRVLVTGRRLARKSLRLCLAGLRIRHFDPIAEASELPYHSRRALLLGLFGDGWASFFVTGALVQDQPDQSTLSMGNGPDGLIVSQARD